MKDPKIVAAALSFSNANLALKNQQVEKFLMAMGSFGQVFGDVPELNVRSLSAFPTIKNFGENGVKIFFKAVHEFFSSFELLTTSEELLKTLPAFAALGDQTLRKTLKFLSQLAASDDIDILTLPEHPDFKKFSDQNIKEMLELVTQLLKQALVELNTKNFREIEHLKRVGDADLQNFFLSLWSHAKNTDGVVDFINIFKWIQSLNNKNKETLVQILSELAQTHKSLDIIKFPDTTEFSGIAHTQIGDLFCEMSKLLKQAFLIDRKKLMQAAVFANCDNVNLRIFFEELVDVISLGRGVVTSGDLKEIPSVRALNNTDRKNLTKFVEAIWLLTNEFFENKFANVKTIEMLSEIEAIKELGGIEKLLAVMQELSEYYKKVLNNARIEEVSALPAFHNLGDQYIRIVFTMASEVLRNNDNIVNCKNFSKQAIFGTIQDKYEKDFFREFWILVLETKGLMEREQILALPSYQLLSDPSKAFLLETLQPLWKEAPFPIDSQSLALLGIFENPVVKEVQPFFQGLWELARMSKEQINFNVCFLSGFRILDDSHKKNILDMLGKLIGRPLEKITIDSLPSVPYFQDLKDSGIKIFFKSLWELILTSSFIEVNELIKLPVFSALSETQQQQVSTILSNLKTHLEYFIDTKKFADFRTDRTDDVAKIFLIIGALLKKSFILINFKSVHSQLTLTKSEIPYANVFIEMYNLLRKRRTTLNMLGLLNLEAFKALKDSQTKQLLAGMSNLLVSSSLIVNSTDLFMHPFIKNISDGATRQFLKELWYLLLEGGIDVNDIVSLPSFNGLEASSKNAIVITLKKIENEAKKSIINLKLEEIPGLVALGELYVERFFLALGEFSRNFKQTLELQQSFSQTTLAFFNPETEAFFAALVNMQKNFEDVSEFSLELKNVARQTKRFSAWCFKLNPNSNLERKKSPAAYAGKIVLASTLLNLYLMKSSLKRAFRLSDTLAKEVDLSSNFSSFRRLISLFKDNKLHAFDEKDKDFFSIQITKADMVALLHSHFLKLQEYLNSPELAKILSGEEVLKILPYADSEKLLASILRLYKFNVPNELYTEIDRIERAITTCRFDSKELVQLSESKKTKMAAITNLLKLFYDEINYLQLEIQNLSDRCFEKIKDSAVLSKLVNLDHYKTLLELGYVSKDLEDTRYWFELAFIVAKTAEDKEIAADRLKQVYLESKKPTNSFVGKQPFFKLDKRASEDLTGEVKRHSAVDLKKVTDVFGTDRKNLRSTVVPNFLDNHHYPKNLLAQKIKEIKASGDPSRIFRIGELYQIRFVFLTMGVQELEKKEDTLLWQNFGELYYSVYMKAVASRGGKNNIDKVDPVNKFFFPKTAKQIDSLFTKKEVELCIEILDLFLTAFKYDPCARDEIKIPLDQICNLVYFFYQGTPGVYGYTDDFGYAPKDPEAEKLTLLIKKSNEANTKPSSEKQTNQSQTEVSGRSRALGPAPLPAPSSTPPDSVAELTRSEVPLLENPKEEQKSISSAIPTISQTTNSKVDSTASPEEKSFRSLAAMFPSLTEKKPEEQKSVKKKPIALGGDTKPTGVPPQWTKPTQRLSGNFNALQQKATEPKSKRRSGFFRTVGAEDLIPTKDTENKKRQSQPDTATTTTTPVKWVLSKKTPQEVRQKLKEEKKEESQTPEHSKSF